MHHVTAAFIVCGTSLSEAIGRLEHAFTLEKQCSAKIEAIEDARLGHNTTLECHEYLITATLTVTSRSKARAVQIVEACISAQNVKLEHIAIKPE